MKELIALWNYKISLIPVLATYVLFDFPAVIRRLTGLAYLPIYFIFFPLGHSDRLYAQYFNEDWFYGDGLTMSETQKRSLRTKLRLTAIFSMFFAAILAPYLCGFTSAFYLTKNQFVEFLWFLLAAKTLILIFVLKRLREESPAARKSFHYIILIYVTYLFLIWRGLTKAFEWTHAHLELSGVLGVVIGLLEYAYVDIFINVVIVGALTWAIMTKFTEPKNIERLHDE